MPDTYAEKSHKRFQFLKKTYDETDGNRLSRVSMWTIGTSLGFDRAETMKLYEYLRDEGLVEAAALGGSINITHAGILEIEETEKEPQKPTEHFPANIINIQGNVTGAALQVGNTNSTQTANITVSGQEVESLKVWLDKLKENVPALGLSAEDTQAMMRHVTTLENETKEKEPAKSVLKTALDRVKGLLEIVGGHMIAAQLLTELPLLTQHLHL